MAEVLVLRHADWDMAQDKLTESGRQRCLALADKLPQFARVISSPAVRAQETAKALTGQTPEIDPRAGVLQASPEQQAQISARRTEHPLGVVGVLFEIKELRGALEEAGRQMADLIRATLEDLADDDVAMIVSHDGTMVVAEKILRGESLASVTKTYRELDGYYVGKGADIEPFVSQ